MTWQRLSKRPRRFRSERKGEMLASSGVRRMVSGKCLRRGESGGSAFVLGGSASDQPGVAGRDVV